MDIEKIKIIISIIVALTTFITSIYSIRAFKSQKKYEKNETAFKEFYLPLMQIIEQHLYETDFTKPSFKAAKSSIHKLFQDKYMYVPFKLQKSFLDFEKEESTKTYNDFCDNLIELYCNSTKDFGIKILTVRQRNKFKWYSSIWKMIATNILHFLNCIYYILVILSIWFLGMSLFFKLLSWLNIKSLI